MSHFTVLVIGQEPEKQLEPFYEGLETPRYVIKYTKEQLIENGKKEIENYKEGRYAEYLSNPEKYSEDCNEGHLNYVKNEFPLKLSWTDEEIYADQIKYYEPEEIGDLGEVYSTCNPKSKWDWYQLGGRWAGQILLKEGVEKISDPNFSWGWDENDKVEVLKENRVDSALKSQIANLDEISTFAVLKDGQWYERGEMGWFAMVRDEKPEEQWKNEFKILIESLPDDTLLSIYDCHI